MQPVTAQSHLPPPRDYHHHPAPLPSLPPAYAPNSSVPQFIRALAFLVFVVGGTTSAAVTWIYKSLIYPRLVLALQARTRLHNANLSMYDGLLSSLRLLKNAPGFQRIKSPAFEEAAAAEGGGKEEEAVVEQSEAVQEKEAVPEKQSKAEEAGVPAEQEGAELDDEATPPLPPPATVLLPIQTSLSSLASALPPSGTSTTLPARIAHAPYPTLSDARSPSEGLLGALSSLNSYLETETYAVVTSAYRSYGAQAATGGSKDRTPLLDAVSNLKAEIRSVKGALLNRRNFAALAPRGEIAA
ncbi:hypothetical protein BCR35DRAFT_303879 [Leucosporidium creatinivorum]|uniref:Peroxin-14 n=1 Tax=Leucosporidium creatinivorum TaxID=106004 RepID=A0A1Y2FEL5_9BASI|nr:hypothetical protein BCR35DRAFT_303879 [Leucosporidium creatinivorum]